MPTKTKLQAALQAAKLDDHPYWISCTACRDPDGLPHDIPTLLTVKTGPCLITCDKCGAIHQYEPPNEEGCWVARRVSERGA